MLEVLSIQTTWCCPLEGLWLPGSFLAWSSYRRSWGSLWHSLSRSYSELVSIFTLISHRADLSQLRSHHWFHERLTQLEYFMYTTSVLAAHSSRIFNLSWSRFQNAHGYYTYNDSFVDLFLDSVRDRRLCLPKQICASHWAWLRQRSSSGMASFIPSHLPYSLLFGGLSLPLLFL